MINDQCGRVGILNRLQLINKAHRTITTNDNGILIANYKTSPVALQEVYEQVNEIVSLSMVDNAEEQLQQYNDEIDNLASQLLALKSDIGYQDVIQDFINTYPQFRELFE